MKPRVPARNQAMFIKFVTFLKEQGALESYFDSEIDSDVFEESYIWWVSSGFVWDDTLQGWNYWDNIYTKWEELCKSY